jgi:hypothetical protein
MIQISKNPRLKASIMKTPGIGNETGERPFIRVNDPNEE